MAFSEYYAVEISDNVFTVPNRYKDFLQIGHGSQGVVCSALDTVLNQRVAIKKLFRAFENHFHARRSYRELKLLKILSHKNLIRLLDTFTPSNSFVMFEEFYVVTELMDFNLKSVIMSTKWHHSRLSFVIYQILCGLRYLHTAGIIHRDLKPDNIAMNTDNTLKIIDFGLARAHIDSFNKTSYVVTRFYRAPEIIVGKDYKELVDIWSLGCIFAELLRGMELFRGENQIDQWIEIVQQLGTPAESFFEGIPPTSQTFLKELPQSEGHSFEELFPDILFEQHNAETRVDLSKNAEARDLLSKMLKIDPSERISVEAAIKHSYLAEWYEETEMDIIQPIVYDYCFEDQELTTENWKQLIFEEIKYIPLPR